MSEPTGYASDVFLPGGALRAELFRDDGARAIEASIEFARKTRWDCVRSPHLFMGLLEVGESGLQDWGERIGAHLPRLLVQFEELFFQDDGEVNPTVEMNREFFSDNVIRMLREAARRAEEHDRLAVTSMDLLICIFTTPHSIVAECFERIGLTAARLTELAVLSEQRSFRVV